VGVQQQKDYWDKVANDKEFRTPLQIELFSRYVGKEAHILDYGCGYGRILKELTNHGYTRLSGVDLSRVMIERAQVTCPQANLQVGDGYRIPFADSSLDAVTLIAVLTSIPPDEAQVHLLKEIYRVLKPQGYLYVNDFLLNQDERNQQRYDRDQAKYDRYGVFELPDGGVQRHHDPTWIQQLFSPFKQIVYEETIYTTMNGNPANGFYYLGHRPDTVAIS